MNDPRFLRRALCVGLASVLGAIAADQAGGEDWPAWRGPRGDGVSAEQRAPTRWSADENVRWVVQPPGLGHSSPIVSRGRVFLTACEEQDLSRLLVCFDRRTGEELWRRVVATSPIEVMHRANSPASSTPASDGEAVFTTFIVNGEYAVDATNHAGEPLWSRRLGPYVSRHGFHSCPVLHGDSLLLAGLQDSDASFVARVDKETGDVVWQTKTDTPIRSFAPPHVSSWRGRKAVVVSGAACTSGFDFQTGKLLWRIDGPAEKTVSSIVESDGRLFVCGGRDNCLLAIDRDEQGMASIAWRSTKGVPYVPSPLFAAGALHLLSDRGVVTRVDPTNGATLARLRLSSGASASPIVVGDHLYLSDDSGSTTVLSLSNGYETVSVNSIGDPIFASPAVSDGEIFLRSASRLYCIGPDQGLTAARRSDEPQRKAR